MSYPYNGEFINSGLTYSAYRKGINEALAQPDNVRTAGKYREYVLKNVELMDDYDESYRVSDELKAALETAPAATWLVISEGWCGDAAFNVPLLAKVEKEMPEKVRLRLFLRDDNPELMDAHLTDGGRSIPKLIVLNKDLNESGTWGPRPGELQKLMKVWKSEGIELKELIPKVQAWYDTDATRSLKAELTAMVRSYSALTENRIAEKTEI